MVCTLQRARCWAAGVTLGVVAAVGPVRAQQAAPAAQPAAAPAPAATSAQPSAQLVVKNEMGNAFELVKVEYALDNGAAQTKEAGALPGVNKGQEMVLLEEPVALGPHVVSVELSYRGTGYGVFSYLKGYQFTLKANHTFNVEKGDTAVVRVVAFEKGDLTTEIKDRPAVRVEGNVRNPAREAREEQARQAEEAGKAAKEEMGLKTADEAYEARMRALEERSNQLQARIDQTRTRMATLQDAVLTGTTQAGGAHILLRNDMGNSFRLREVHFNLDGAAIRDQVDLSGDVLGGRDSIDVFDGRLVPGTHILNVQIIYQGVGYGVFSYLNDYQFRLRSTHNFVVEQGRKTTLTTVAYESGDARTEVKDRPTLRFEEASEALIGAPPPAQETPAEPQPAPAAGEGASEEDAAP